MLGENLITLRKSAKLTQSDMGGILGIDRSTYAYYESNKTAPSLTNLVSLARVFNVTVDELIGASDGLLLNDPESVKGASLSEEALALSDLSQDELKLIAKLRIKGGNGLSKLLEALDGE